MNRYVLFVVHCSRVVTVADNLWLHIASYLGWPVSTTHSIVGGVVGFGVIAGGMDVINWGKSKR